MTQASPAAEELWPLISDEILRQRAAMSAVGLLALSIVGGRSIAEYATATATLIPRSGNVLPIQPFHGAEATDLRSKEWLEWLKITTGRLTLSIETPRPVSTDGVYGRDDFRRGSRSLEVTRKDDLLLIGDPECSNPPKPLEQAERADLAALVAAHDHVVNHRWQLARLGQE